MKARGRTEETGVTLDYLKQLHNLHEDWLICRQKTQPAPVLVLDGDLDMDNIVQEYIRCEKIINKRKND